MQNNKIIIIIIVVLAAIIIFGGGSYWAFKNMPAKQPAPSSAPPKSVIKTDEPSSKNNEIQVSIPKPNSVVTSPLNITGQARGTWFFEGSFYVELLNKNGSVIGSGMASSTEDWMTEEFIPYTVNIEFAQPTTKAGEIVLRKDNPSGRPEFDNKLIVPVKFN